MANYNYSQFPTAPQFTQNPAQNYLNMPMGTPVGYNPTPMTQESQTYFPQPQGAVYMIRSSSDVNNIPITNGLSASICLTDGTLFIKTMQNGNPSMIGYKLIPLDNQITNQTPATQTSPKESEPSQVESKLAEVLSQFNDRLSAIENSLSPNKGGTEKWQL